MARSVQVRKMTKRKRSTPWGTKAKKKARRLSIIPGISSLNRDLGFPDSLRTKIKYADVLTLTGGAGIVGSDVYNMNGCADPYVGVGGHQPMWFDQLCGAQGSAPYARYRVNGSRIKVTFSIVSPPSLAAVNVAPVVVGLSSQRSSVLTASSTAALLESSNCNTRILGDKGSGASTVTVYESYNPKTAFGIESTEDESFSAPYTAVPSIGWYTHLFKVDDTGSSSVKAYLEIVYDVTFYSRNEVAQS